MRVLPEKDVYLVLAVWKMLCAKYGVQFVEELRQAFKLMKCVQAYVEGWREWDLAKKMDWLSKYLEWVIVSGKRFSSAWRWVVQYLDMMVVEDGVQEVVDTYREYVKERFGKEVDVDVTKKDVVVAARVIRKVASELGLSIKEVIKYQHECWEKIDRPLVFERMSNEGKVRRRVEVYLRERKKAGDVIKRGRVEEERVDKERKEVEEVWKTVMKVGVMFYANKSGFVGLVARECWEKMKSAKNLAEKLLVLQQYTAEKVYDRWVKEGKPSLF